MFFVKAVALAAALPLVFGQQLTNETVLGVYMFHRHGDRTAKILGPTNLTDLGYLEVFTSGTYYRDRYIASNGPYRISGINTDFVMQSQIQASAPLDDVLQNSAAGFLQALYPPVGPGMDTETLGNGTTITSPMNGFQLIPVEIVSSGSGSEDNTWLQSTSDCLKAEISSNEFFYSAEYNDLEFSTQDFYTRLAPVVNTVFNVTENNFKNAYEIFDYINVGEIHNSSIPSGALLNSSTLFQVRTLADQHEWGLSYNMSEPIRSVAGMELAAQVVQFLNGTIEDAGVQDGQKFAVQFGAYNNFQAFFGLVGLPAVNVDFIGVCDYASAMTFEMFTNASTAVTTANYPSADDIYVRFLFHNGTTSNFSEPVAYPLFGTGQEVLSWNDFQTSMNGFALADTQSWCSACGNTTGICAPYAPSSSSSSSSGSGSSSGKSGNGLSPAVNGVIGAMVTLAVVLGLEALLMLIFGLRLVSKKRLQSANGSVSPGGAEPKA